VSRKQLASLGSAESLTGVPKDEILDNLSDNHIKIYVPDVLQDLVPSWTFYFDNGLWRVGLSDISRSVKSQKTPNGFQYYLHALSHPDEGFDPGWLCHYFGASETESLRGAEDIETLSEEMGTDMALDGLSQNIYDDRAEEGIKVALRNIVLRRSELDPDDVLGHEILNVEADEIRDWANEGSYPGGRRTFDDSSDKAASNVSGAMKRARDKIEALGYPEIAAYLKNYVSGGKVVVYEPPEDEPHWVLTAPEKTHEK